MAGLRPESVRPGHCLYRRPDRWVRGVRIVCVAKITEVTFLKQGEPVEEHGRALYAVARSVVRALLDQLGAPQLAVLNTDRTDVTLAQLAYVVRLNRDKGMLGDGFEWAVHEAILGGEPRVLEPIAETMSRASPTLRDGRPESLLFGYERARYLGFLEAVVDNAGREAVLLPDGSGRPFAFGSWVPIAAQGKAAEPLLAPRIAQVWKTDLFLSVEDSVRYAAATIKSNHRQLEDGKGLRIGIVPEAKDLRSGYHRRDGLHIAALPDPDGFMGLFHDGYQAVGRALSTLGQQEPPPYWSKPSAKAQRLQAQLEKYGPVTVLDIEGALNEAAQQRLISSDHSLVSVEAPEWLHMTERAVKVVAPKPSFEKLD